MTTKLDRATGVLLGLACGDALGRPVEFNSPHRIQDEHGRVTEMLADGTHRKPAGTITDDTELALCIARSLSKRRHLIHQQSLLTSLSGTNLIPST
jgi:ADP-ribosylglycohydrolase